jgi:Uma2 family endonuclease
MAAAATTEHAARAEMSLAEWAALPEDDDGELVDGQLVEEEVPEPNHESIVAWLLVVLWSWAVPRGGFVFGSEIKLAVRPRRGRKPDLSVYLPGGPIPRRRGAVRVPPGIIVEVIAARCAA